MKAIIALSVAALSLSFATMARATVITYDCGDLVVRGDTKTGAVLEIDKDGKRIPGHGVKLDSEFFYYGLNDVQPLRINRKTGQMQYLNGGAWLNDPDPTPCRPK